jgi:hypothetical protein
MNTRTSAWIVTKTNWQYNDEYYYPPEGRGGEAVTAYRDKAAAEAKLQELNRQAARNDFCLYLGEDASWELKNVPEELLNRSGIDRDDPCNSLLNPALSDADIDALLYHSKMKFYTLQEVPIL